MSGLGAARRNPHPESEAALLELGVHLAEGRFPEVPHFEELVGRAQHEFANGRDTVKGSGEALDRQ